MRGKHYRARRTRQRSGITPAGAGKTRTRGECACSSRDHPRRCGENAYQVGFAFNTVGSPPQVRGKHQPLDLCMYYAGITPAGAGKTHGFFWFNGYGKDHPRRCGENAPLPLGIFWLMGSPPQVRGKQGRTPTDILYRGITPAGAGKTDACCLGCSRNGDHPRRCGENVSILPLTLNLEGSPPQVRGKLSHNNIQSEDSRITPAGAGKTIQSR